VKCNIAINRTPPAYSGWWTFLGGHFFKKMYRATIALIFVFWRIYFQLTNLWTYSFQWDKSNALNINCGFIYFWMGLCQNWFFLDSCKSGLFLEPLSFLGLLYY
jgi:hypothetical protein